MREEIADLVHPVLAYGLKLKERLERGESPDLAAEQQALKGLLRSPSEARRWPDFGGDGGVESGRFNVTQTAGPATRTDTFLGSRYALVCWLDEIFTLDSRWADEWNHRKLEEALYGITERAWLFWEQVRRAETKGTDALEAFYLCVMLGFRGTMRHQPEKLEAWRSAVEGRISREQNKELRLPEALDPPTYVPPLAGRGRFQKMLLAASLAGGALILVGAFFFINAFRS